MLSGKKLQLCNCYFSLFKEKMSLIAINFCNFLIERLFGIKLNNYRTKTINKIINKIVTS